MDSPAHPVWLGTGQPLELQKGAVLINYPCWLQSEQENGENPFPIAWMGWGLTLPSSQAVPWEELVLVPTFPSPLLPLESSSAPPSHLCLLLSNKAIDIHCETRLSRPAHTTNLIPFSACQRGWYCSVSHMIVCWSFSRKWSHHQHAFTNLSHLALAGCQGGCSLENLSSSLLKCFVLHWL